MCAVHSASLSLTRPSVPKCQVLNSHLGIIALKTFAAFRQPSARVLIPVNYSSDENPPPRTQQNIYPSKFKLISHLVHTLVRSRLLSDLTLIAAQDSRV